MGIIAHSNKTSGKPMKPVSRKEMADALLWEAAQPVVSPVDGQRMTKLQAVAKRAFSTAITAESDKDAQTSAKWIWERIFGRAPVQKLEKKNEIPAMVFAVREDDIGTIAKKAALANPELDDEFDDDAEAPEGIGIVTDDGEEFLV